MTCAFFVVVNADGHLDTSVFLLDPKQYEKDRHSVTAGGNNFIVKVRNLNKVLIIVLNFVINSKLKG